MAVVETLIDDARFALLTVFKSEISKVREKV